MEEQTTMPESPETAIREGEPVSSDEGILPEGEPTHVVQRGDTLYSLGRRYGVSWQTLMTHNNLHDPTNLNVGQVLRIPAGAGTAPGPDGDGETLYTVQYGDSLYEIGLLFGMNWKRIAERNGLAYVVQEPEPRRRTRKSYAENFKYGRVGSWTH